MNANCHLNNVFFKSQTERCPTCNNSRFAPWGTPILGHIRDVRPEWVSFPGRKPADGRKFSTKNLQMGHNFDIILPGNGWVFSELNKTYCSLVNFYCK